MRGLIIASVLLGGCASLGLAQREGVPLTAHAASSAGHANVYVLELRHGLVILRVVNAGPGTLTINRHNVLLRMPSGKLREPEDFAGDEKYVLEAGEDHQVNVRFRLNSLEDGDQVELDFAEAFFADGKPLQAQPIPLRITDE